MFLSGETRRRWREYRLIFLREACPSSFIVGEKEQKKMKEKLLSATSTFLSLLRQDPLLLTRTISENN
ncbi:hypothetical protein OUZ56_007535 [Daphnia magna]|uniref:Uncharacterized protein n=1 Tax=Daphnia magna TaxID=35525 RepID=A0ABR0AAN8_9CRUS|nr:hypothetical protein OUZ56_007535 [Daphnia magna]